MLLKFELDTKDDIAFQIFYLIRQQEEPFVRPSGRKQETDVKYEPQ